MSEAHEPVAVVGAGLAGLACALHLHAAGVPLRVFEAADDVGGRVRTDLVDGFQIDRGFQVLTTSYPEAQRVLDLPALALGRFAPGAWVRVDGRFARFLDPLRRPRELLRTLGSGVMPLPDQLRVLALRREVTAGPLEVLYARPEQSALARLQQRGFGPRAIERFFRPFFAGVFLERELSSSSRCLDFAFRHFARGDAALPAGGMAAIPRQLAARLPAGCVETKAPVEAIDAGALWVAGARVPCAAVVVATDGEAARRLVPALPEVAHHPATCLSFAAELDPVGEPVLVLDGEQSGPVNHLCVPSAVTQSYAPAGRALVSASVVGSDEPSDAALERVVRAQLTGWFGGVVASWRLLRIDRIAKALPRQPVGWLEPVERPAQVAVRTFVCGDHRDLASLNGALRSGRRAALAVAAALGIPDETLARGEVPKS